VPSTIAAFGVSDVGRKRKHNEDAFDYKVDDSGDEGLFIVADGMGGHAAGEVASKITVETVGEFIAATRQKEEATWPFKYNHELHFNSNRLAIAIEKANERVMAAVSAQPWLKGMGTTVVAARFSPNKQRLYVGHVGDSRCYRLRDDTLVQMTTDHTMAAHGYKGREAAFLTRAIGIAPTVTIDMIIAKPKPEDIYLLCSDGLSKMATDVDIRDILATSKDLEQAVVALVDRANGGGGKDNITVVLVAVRQPLSVPPS